ncbi:MAG: DUF2997 domain-containing protein [Caldilinea sp.]|uniref:DUF2997 domain-containing protein n=1 Tax=Caldilinea sp. TaxID=2293560 RepID=UPI002CD911C6|nr:DUF2997 domain-containing protein [Anaerolineales bacterium]HQY93723.1 DUF2997 domain-containing protein [Caldilinea sp.]HRA65985.1 DUF2997 domain-containing protein [Caldilinea sp.]
MQSQEIEISILPDGRVEYTIKGVKGAACENISALLEQMGKVEKAERTGEYFEDDTHVDITVTGA